METTTTTKNNKRYAFKVNNKVNSNYKLTNRQVESSKEAQTSGSVVAFTVGSTEVKLKSITSAQRTFVVNNSDCWKLYIKTGFIIYREGFIEGVGLEDDVRQYLGDLPLNFYRDVDQVIHFSGSTLLESHKSSKSLRIRL